MTTKALNQDNLQQLAAAANRSHKACVDAQRSAALHAKDAGDALLTAKAEVGHGGWTDWLAQNCVFGKRQAQRYMQIASRWDELQTKAGAKTSRASFLTIRMALEILSGAADNGERRSEFRVCHSCGATLCKTSVRWQTCISCWDCKLYPAPVNSEDRVFKFSDSASVIGITEAFDEMDRDAKHKLVAALAKQIGIEDQVNPVMASPKEKPLS